VWADAKMVPGFCGGGTGCGEQVEAQQRPPTLLSQFEKISDWLEQVHHQIVEEEEWTKEMIMRLKHRIGHNLRRLKE